MFTSIKANSIYRPIRLIPAIIAVSVLLPFLLPGVWMSWLDSPEGFMPHLHCWLRDPVVTWIHVTSDSLIGLAYVVISGTLVYMVHRGRHDIPFRSIFFAFGLFIVTCGLTHFMSVVTVWKPLYWLEGDVKVVTAVASVATAVALPAMVPRMFRLIHDARLSDERKRNLEATHEELRELYRTLEQRVSERTTEVEQQAERLRTITVQLASVEQRERRQLAQALHDGLQQLLVGAKMHIEEGQRRLQTGGSLDEILDEAKKILQQSIQASRSFSFELCPPVLYDRGLAAALDWLRRHFQETYGLSVAVDADPKADPTDSDLQAVLFRAIQELLMNVVKHAQATQAWVTLSLDQETLRISVKDDGVGYSPDQALQTDDDHPGFGLFSLRERFRSLGGELKIDSSLGCGTRASLSCPRSPALSREETSQAADRPQRSEPRSSASVSTGDGSSPTSRAIRVMLVDDHPVMREGMASMIDAERDMEIVAEAGDGQEAVEKIDQVAPDVVVMDVSMPRMNGVEATSHIVKNNPDVAVIGLSMHRQDDLANSMLQAGASAYVSKGSPSDDLLRAIRQACTA